jgi:hypothetical protein
MYLTLRSFKFWVKKVLLVPLWSTGMHLERSVHDLRELPYQDLIDVNSTPEFYGGIRPEFDLHNIPEFHGNTKPGLDKGATPGFYRRIIPGIDRYPNPEFNRNTRPGFYGNNRPGFEGGCVPGLGVRAGAVG